MIYTKDNPSQEYIDLIKDYQTIHQKGTANKSPENTYNGSSTIKFADLLKKIISKNNYNTLLDYGSGKGDKYFKATSFTDKTFPPLKDFWQVQPTLFDPGVPHPKPINKKFNIVVSIDVLEHIPYQDLSWVVNEMFEFANDMVFINVACYEALANLPNGKNAHVSVFDAMWWCGFISAIASNYTKKALLVCTNQKKENKYVFYGINDDFSKYK